MELGKPKPKVEPNYRKESMSWTTMVMMALMVGSIALTIITGQNILTSMVIGALLGMTSELFKSMSSYVLAVNFVNSASVEEWSYNNGIAVMRLPGNILAILDTRLPKRRLYLSQEFSAQSYPLLERRRAKSSINFVTFTKPKTINLDVSHKFKSVKVWKGVIEVPSIKKKREVMRILGAFLEIDLESKCLKELSTCIEELVKMLKSVSL
ncbi:MAG: hypothetical protein QXQ20_06310 [Candidatus Nezhaarchaeales archaeon]|nr:MAG: hypothetical protein DSO06_04675 [Candidatus Nezhaarchaeota archaeon WYZ-LMO8]TDA37099.1 MAG: hypothetical protein DSO05_01405 [Candidatus Nezhaarchaeota archaeon WYZ-LMO7]